MEDTNGYHSAVAGGEGRLVAGLNETGVGFQICTGENTQLSVPLERSILRDALIHGRQARPFSVWRR